LLQIQHCEWSARSYELLEGSHLYIRRRHIRSKSDTDKKRKKKALINVSVEKNAETQ